MVLESIIESKFWIEWQDRFEKNYRRYIDPNDVRVKRYADNLSIRQTNSEYETAKKLWSHVDNSYTYKLSKEWKEPSKTIREGIGDCEDYVFLLGALFPHFGINNYEVVIGDVIAGGDSQLHTWMRVDGKIVDPTTGPGELDGLEYEEVKSYTVEVE